MKRLSEEKLKILAEKYGWSIARVRGYIAGETCRRSGTAPSTYALVGFDDYCVGFRAGFFVRTSQRSTSDAQSGDEQSMQGAVQIAPGEKPQAAYLMSLERRSDPLRRSR
jgi:hypothetical protein